MINVFFSSDSLSRAGAHGEIHAWEAEDQSCSSRNKDNLEARFRGLRFVTPQNMFAATNAPGRQRTYHLLGQDIVQNAGIQRAVPLEGLVSRSTQHTFSYISVGNYQISCG